MPRAHFMMKFSPRSEKNSGDRLTRPHLSFLTPRNNLLSGPLIYWSDPMKRRAGIMFVGALLALTLWSLTGYGADDDDDKQMTKDAQAAVLKLMDAMNGGKGDVKNQVEAIHKKFPELKFVM